MGLAIVGNVNTEGGEAVVDPMVPGGGGIDDPTGVMVVAIVGIGDVTLFNGSVGGNVTGGSGTVATLGPIVTGGVVGPTGGVATCGLSVRPITLIFMSILTGDNVVVCGCCATDG